MASADGVVLAIAGLRLSRGTREVLCGVDLTVTRGEVVALMGLSGSGKTTVLRACVGLEPFDAGEIRVDDKTLSARMDPRQARRALDQKEIALAMELPQGTIASRIRRGRELFRDAASRLRARHAREEAR